MQGFATQQDFQEALSIFVSEFIGGKPGTKQLVLAATNVLSYGANLATSGLSVARAGTTTLSLTVDEARSCCEETITLLKGSGEGRSKIDWSKLPWDQLLSIALSILKKYVPWLPVPALPEPPAPDGSPVRPG